MKINAQRQGLVTQAKALEALAKKMKSIKHIFDTLLDKDRIKKIITLAARHKHKRREVQKVLANIDFYAEEILNMLKNGEYPIKPTANRTICERGKTRELTVSPFYPNRILDYIIVETLKPYIRKSMYEYCIGNVDKRGMVYGKKIIAKKYGKYKYYIKLDIHHFYPSVSSECLTEMLTKRIRDDRFLNLCKAVVMSAPNMPIGSYYSQWFSNWFLQDLDHKIKEQYHIEFYVRYVDDMLLMGNSKRRLLNAMYGIERWLALYGLSLKRHDTPHTVAETPIDFLGFRFRENDVRLRLRNFKGLNKRVRKVRKNRHVSVSQARRLLSYLGWLKQIKIGFMYYKNHIATVIKNGTLRHIISAWTKNENNRKLLCKVC